MEHSEYFSARQIAISDSDGENVECFCTLVRQPASLPCCLVFSIKNIPYTLSYFINCWRVWFDIRMVSTIAILLMYILFCFYLCFDFTYITNRFQYLILRTYYLSYTNHASYKSKYFAEHNIKKKKKKTKLKQIPFLFRTTLTRIDQGAPGKSHHFGLL